MENPLIRFIKKSYKILIVVAAAVIFFLGYNTYLVDHSMVNLRIALNKVSDAKTLQEAKKLSDLLDYPLLKEAGSTAGMDVKNMAQLELARAILDTSGDIAQLSEVKLMLEEAIIEKESANPAAVILNKINQFIILPAAKASGAVSAYEAGRIKQEIAKTKDKNILQEYYHQLGNIYLQAKDYRSAREVFLKGVGLDPGSETAKKINFSLGWLEKFQGDLDASKEIFDDIIAESPADNLALLSRYQVADIYHKKKDYERAADLFYKLANEHPELKSAELAAFQVGYIYLHDIKDYQRAQEAFAWAKDKFKGTKLSNYINTVITKYINKNYRQEGYIRLEDGFKLLKEGYQKSSLEKYSQAINSFDQAIQLYPQDGASYIGKALAFFWMGDEEEALQLGRKAEKISSDDEAVSVNLGYLYLQLGLVEEAITEYKRFISISPLSSRGFYNLGCAYQLKNKLDDALAAFRRAGKIDPQFASAFNNQGYCLWRLGKYAEAIEAFNRAARIDPKLLDAFFNLALAYKSTGRYEEALEKIKTVIKINPDYPDAGKQLKDIEKFLLRKNVSP